MTGKMTQIMQKKDDFNLAKGITRVNRDHTSLLTCIFKGCVKNYPHFYRIFSFTSK